LTATSSWNRERTFTARNKTCQGRAYDSARPWRCALLSYLRIVTLRQDGDALLPTVLGHTRYTSEMRSNPLKSLHIGARWWHGGARTNSPCDPTPSYTQVSAYAYLNIKRWRFVTHSSRLGTSPCRNTGGTPRFGTAT